MFSMMTSGAGSVASLMQNMGDLSQYGKSNSSGGGNFNWKGIEQNMGRQYASDLPNYGSKPMGAFMNGIDISAFIR